MIMSIIAKLRYLRISPRKVRLVADLIRGKTVEQAQYILSFTIKRTSDPLLKLLKSAIANAKNNFHLDKDNLYISKILVDEGPKNKRFLPRARGRADQIEKKSSHITITLDELKKTKVVKKVKEIKKVEKVEKNKKLEVQPVKSSEAGPSPSQKGRVFNRVKRPKIERGIKRIFKRKAF